MWSKLLLVSRWKLVTKSNIKEQVVKECFATMSDKPSISASKVLKSTTPDLFAVPAFAIGDTHTPELVIALCGPIGSPIHTVSRLLKKLLEEQFNYDCQIIRLSSLIEARSDGPIPRGNFERIQCLIDNGNRLRVDHGASILVDLAISGIAENREQRKIKSESKRYEVSRTCHIIDSVKNQEELASLRSVYRDMFYFIGVFSPLQERQKSLETQGMKLPEVYSLIDRDSGEELGYGQTVRNTFPQADFFLRADSDSDKPIESKLLRFLDIIFETDVATPTSAETAMYMAASSAANSGCLSRQVGAALTDQNGEIISIGWNDVPKAKGGVYSFDPKGLADGTDHRCASKGEGHCLNDQEKNEMVEEILNDLVLKGVVSETMKSTGRTLISESRIDRLIEFSRSVHAEMHAIILGSQSAGDRVKGGKLFCTTYPCHYCAGHIIMAGITEVYYIEPYRKSLAIKLHGDAITDIESETDKVRILSFDGVAPERYLGLFRMKSRESRKLVGGKRKILNRKTAVPKCEVTLESLPALEALIVNKLLSQNVIKPAEKSE